MSKIQDGRYEKNVKLRISAKISTFSININKQNLFKMQIYICVEDLKKYDENWLSSGPLEICKKREKN